MISVKNIQYFLWHSLAMSVQKMDTTLLVKYLCILEYDTVFESTAKSIMINKLNSKAE